MSVYDRTYMNEDEPGGGGKSAISILIAINIIVWFVWAFARESGALSVFMNDHFTVTVDGILQHYRVHTLLTYAISHKEPIHLLMNILFFWFLCDEVERVYGKLNFFLLYAFCGGIGGLAHLAFSAYAVREGASDIPMLGASGAILGVAVIAAIFDPNRPINFMGIIPVPLRLLVMIYIAMDLYSVIGNVSALYHESDRPISTLHVFVQGGVAYFAHIGGALGGLLFWKLDLRAFRTRGRLSVGWVDRLRRWLMRPRAARGIQEVPRELPREPVAQRHGSARASAGAARRASGRRQVDAATSQRVDELLSKISREGMNSLTDEERRFLQESSQKYRE